MSGFSKEEIIGKHSSSIFTIEDKEMREKILDKIGELFEKGFTTFESIFMSKEGKCVDVECTCSMIKDEKGDYTAGVSIFRDITERKEMENKLLQSEKLKSLGELAGGVAHDFNNALAAILGRAQLLRMNVEPPPGKKERRESVDAMKKGLEVIERAAKDGAETVRRIQEFARRREDDKHFTTVDLNEIIDNALEFTSMRWKNDAESKGVKINIEKEFSTLPSTSGSASELREVFTNLINNSIDAMPQGGDIKIKTFKKDSYIYIKVKDTGVGIANDRKDRIFDPFFTTKGVHSSGLGLSVSYGIINRHQGTITVDSTEGQGTTFTIRFPLSEKMIEEKKAESMPEKQRKAKILVIDDEGNVCELLKDILTDKGHKVETASNGSQGVEIFKGNRFDLVFTDLGMPGMSGWQVAEEIKKINRKVPVVLITGWGVQLKDYELREKGVDFLVSKPFQVDQVLKLVQECMILIDRFKAA
jgi:PAS domain S-box-containing protein